MLHPQYPIRTERLLLRPFGANDLHDLHAYQRLPEVVQYLYWDIRDEAASRDTLDRKRCQSALMDEGQGLVLAIELPEQARVIGEVTLAWLSRVSRQGEVGFVLHPAYHGRGFATEAAAEMLRLGFTGLALHRIIGRCDARNVASARVLERLGMRREAHFVQNELFKGEWGDEYVYAILASEWRRHGGSSRSAPSAPTRTVA